MNPTTLIGVAAVAVAGGGGEGEGGGDGGGGGGGEEGGGRHVLQIVDVDVQHLNTTPLHVVVPLVTPAQEPSLHHAGGATQVYWSIERCPQSLQSVPKLQKVNSAPGPPSSQSPSVASLHVFEQYWLYGEWVCGAWLCGVWLCGECGWWLCGEWPCGEWLCGVWLCAGGGGGGLPVVGHGVSVLHKISPQHLKDCPAHVMAVVDVPPPPGEWE